MKLKKYNQLFTESMEFEDIDIIIQSLKNKNIQYELKDDNVLVVQGLEYELQKYKSSRQALEEIEKHIKTN